MELARKILDPSTPEGLQKLIEKRTGDKELAERILTLGRVKVAESNIPKAMKMFGMGN